MDDRFRGGVSWSDRSTSGLHALEAKSFASSSGCGTLLLFSEDGPGFDDWCASAAANNHVGIYMISDFSRQAEERERI
jgi:hypothetical protein